jgi:catalase-peroxidase
LAEVYAEAGSQTKFVTDFVTAWNKIMNADRYDIVRH